MGDLWNAIWTNGLIAWIFAALQFFYAWVHDYGFAIILLTIAFRVILIPLTWKQTKSMYELQAIQPKIKALQEKYKNNKEKQQEEMMKFYQENKVNPFGGCLPLLLQMPLFFALFTVLRTNLPNFIDKLPLAAQATAKQFWIILPDITKTPQAVYQIVSAVPTHTIDPQASAVATSAIVAGQGGVAAGVIAALPYVVFVILFGLSVWLPQYLMTKDPTQRRTGTYMAIMMLWFGFVSPAGVLIYWVTSSAWQVGQQLILQRMLAAGAQGGAASPPDAGKPESTSGKGGKKPSGTGAQAKKLPASSPGTGSQKGKGSGKKKGASTNASQREGADS